MVFHLCGPQGCPTPGCFPVPQWDVWWLQEPTAPLGRVHGADMRAGYHCGTVLGVCGPYSCEVVLLPHADIPAGGAAPVL